MSRGALNSQRPSKIGLACVFMFSHKFVAAVHVTQEQIVFKCDSAPARAANIAEQNVELFVFLARCGPFHLSEADHQFAQSSQEQR